MSRIRANTIVNGAGTGAPNFPRGAIISGISTINADLNATNVSFSGITTTNQLSLGTGTSISSPATNTLALGTNSSERLRITSDGKIGIGTDNPVAKLHVSGSAWSNTTGGDVVISNSGIVGSSLNLRPTNSGSYSAGWSLYAGASSSAIGDGSIGFWNHTEEEAPFKIDQDGRLTKPLTPAFLAYHQASDLNYAVGDTLAYPYTLYNIGNHYNTSNSTFTAPVAGRYLFSANAQANYETGVGGVPRAYWKVNGNNVANSIHLRGSDNQNTGVDADGLEQRSQTVIFNLAANDTVKIVVVQNRWDLFGANSFIGYLIG